MDNFILKIRDPEGDEVFGLSIGSMLDNVFKFGAKDNRYKHHEEWANSNCCIETVCASATVIYRQPESEKYHFFVRAVENLYMLLLLLLVNMSHSTMPWLQSHTSQSPIG